MLISYHMHQSNIPQGIYVREGECAFAVTQPVNPLGFVPYSETHVESIVLGEQGQGTSISAVNPVLEERG